MKNNASPVTVRRLRIGNRYFPRMAKRGWHGSIDYINLPHIRLSGKWLQSIGFQIGDYIQVEHSENRIVITRHPDS